MVDFRRPSHKYILSATLSSYIIAWIGMQIIHYKKFCVPVSTGISKGNKLLKTSSDSISDSVIFQNFLGDMPPDLPSVSMLCMPVSCTLEECISQLAPHQQ